MKYDTENGSYNPEYEKPSSERRKEQNEARERNQTYDYGKAEKIARQISEKARDYNPNEGENLNARIDVMINSERYIISVKETENPGAFYPQPTRYLTFGIEGVDYQRNPIPLKEIRIGNDGKIVFGNIRTIIEIEEKLDQPME